LALYSSPDLVFRTVQTVSIGFAGGSKTDCRFIGDFQNKMSGVPKQIAVSVGNSKNIVGVPKQNVAPMIGWILRQLSNTLARISPETAQRLVRNPQREV